MPEICNPYNDPATKQATLTKVQINMPIDPIFTSLVFDASMTAASVADVIASTPAEPRRTRMDGWSDLKLALNLVGNFKALEDPKAPGFITLDHLRNIDQGKEKYITKDTHDYATELLIRNDVMLKFNLDSKQPSDQKRTKQDIANVANKFME